MNAGNAATLLFVAVIVLATLFGQPTRAEREPGPEDESTATASQPVKDDDTPRRIELDADDDDDREKRVADFMRRKLAASGDVLEGLVTEDFDMIEKGAKTMAKMSQASDWKMLKGPMYVQFSNEFRKICDDLGEAADQENVDAAGLAYMRLTMGCITCHNYVRKTMMADAKTIR